MIISHCVIRISTVLHEFSKLSLLEAYYTHHMYGIICLSETYLDSSVPYDDPRLNLSGYKLELTNSVIIKGVALVFTLKRPLLFDQYLLTV